MSYERLRHSPAEAPATHKHSELCRPSSDQPEPLAPASNVTLIDATALAAQVLETGPANLTFGIKVESAQDANATVALELKPELENVIGSLHASEHDSAMCSTASAANPATRFAARDTGEIARHRAQRVAH
jgi:hypothetical protein